jgi:hypothetical protein
MEQYFRFVYLSDMKQHVRNKSAMFILLLSSMVMVILKFGNRTAVSQWSWAVILAPLILALILFFRELMRLIQH